MNWVLHPPDIETDSPVGGKARALAELQGADLPIPAWCVIPPAAFDASLTPAQATALHAARDPESIRAIVETVMPAPAIAAAIRQAAATLDRGAGLAIRSSALGEDSAEHSFAGQLESYLFVTAERAAEFVARVWRSGFGERLIAYRVEAGLPALPRPPAVVMQAMIDGDASGVAFSADPVTGSRATVVVAAVPGLGGTLVSGATDSDTWHVDREGRVVDFNIANKQFAQRWDPDAPDGIGTVALQGDAATRPSLSESSVLAVAELARNAERFFGRPQDIEWTLFEGRLYLLQSRPITGLAAKADPDGRRAIWDNSNIAESYNGITTPFTFSFAARAYESVYRQFCRLMRVDSATMEDHADLFACMLGLIRGRIYYNLYNWYRLMALLPGYARNSRFLEQMLGIRETLHIDRAQLLGKSKDGRLRESLRVINLLVGLVLAYLGLNRRIRRFTERVGRALGATRPDFSRLRADELAAHYRHLEQRLLRYWDAPTVNDFFTMIFHGALQRLIAAWIGDAAGTLQSDLLRAERGMISGEPDRRVRRMAEIAAAISPDFVELLCSGSLIAIRETGSACPAFFDALSAYLDRFGDRCLEELKLESLTLHANPLPLLRSIGHYARVISTRGTTAQRENDDAVYQAAVTRVRTALANRPLRRALLLWVLAATRARVLNRENLRFERTRVFGRARMIALEIGKRLATVDRIDDHRDIFWLEVDEMLGFVEGRATTTDLKGLVALRKAEFEQYRNEPAPADRFETHGMVDVGNLFQSEVARVSPVGESLQGTGCCAGTVRGPVRLVRDPENACVGTREIIVAERTDPGWIMIFPSASGLLVERGSLLSHSAIVARELGLPTIVALTGVTHWLQDGDWVEMDGASGRVTRIANPALAG